MNDRLVGDVSLEVSEFQAASPADRVNVYGSYNRQSTPINRRSFLKLGGATLFGAATITACNAAIGPLPETPEPKPTNKPTKKVDPTVAPTPTIDQEQQRTEQAALHAYERKGSDTSWYKLTSTERDSAISLMARTRQVKLIDPVRAIGRVFDQTHPDGTKIDDRTAPRVPAYEVDNNEVDPNTAVILAGSIVIDGGAVYVNNAGNKIKQAGKDGKGLFLTEVSPDGSIVRQATTPGFGANTLEWERQIDSFVPANLPNSGGAAKVDSETLVERTGSQLNVVNYKLEIASETGKQSLTIDDPADSGINGKPFIKDDGNVYVADSGTSYKWNLDSHKWEEVKEAPIVKTENLEAKIDAWKSGETPSPDPDTLMTVYGKRIGLGSISGPLDNKQKAFNIQGVFLGYKLAPNQEGKTETVLAFGLQAGSITNPVVEASQKPFRYVVLCHTGTEDAAKQAQVINKNSISLDQLGTATGTEVVQDLQQAEYLKLLGESVGKPFFLQFGVAPVVILEEIRNNPDFARAVRAADGITGGIDKALALRDVAYKLSAGGINPTNTLNVDQFSKITDSVTATDLFCAQIAIPHPTQ